MPGHYYGGVLNPAVVTASAPSSSSGGGIVSSLISGGLNLINTAMVNKANRKINEANNQFNAAEAQKARDFSEQFYNQYQSPEAMVRQYEAAGINPALMYGSAPSPSGSPSNASASAASPISMQGIDISNLLTLSQQLESIKGAKLENKNKAIQNEIDSVELKHRDTNITLNQEQTRVAIDGMIEQNKVTRKQLDVLAAEINQMISSTNLNNSQKKFVDAQTLSEVVRRVGLKLDNDFKKGQLKILDYDIIDKYSEVYVKQLLGFDSHSSVFPALMSFLFRFYKTQSEFIFNFDNPANPLNFSLPLP